jgi:hypothetical protein
VKTFKAATSGPSPALLARPPFDSKRVHGAKLRIESHSFVPLSGTVVAIKPAAMLTNDVYHADLRFGVAL